MTGLDIIIVAPGTVIRSNDGRETLTVKPGEPVAKGSKLFVTNEDFDRILAAVKAQHEWSKDNG